MAQGGKIKNWSPTSDSMNQRKDWVHGWHNKKVNEYVAVVEDRGRYLIWHFDGREALAMNLPESLYKPISNKEKARKRAADWARRHPYGE